MLEQGGSQRGSGSAPYDLSRETNAEARGGTGPSPAHQPTAASWRREPWVVSLWFCYHQILKNAGVRVVQEKEAGREELGIHGVG